MPSLKDVLNRQFRISFTRSAARAEIKPPHQTSNGANETDANYHPSGALELSSQPAEIFTIEQLVRASIIDTKGDSEQDVHLNIVMAHHLDSTMNNYSQYCQDRKLIVWRIANHLREEHGYVVEPINSQKPY